MKLTDLFRRKRDPELPVLMPTGGTMFENLTYEELLSKAVRVAAQLEIVIDPAEEQRLQSMRAELADLLPIKHAELQRQYEEHQAESRAMAQGVIDHNIQVLANLCSSTATLEQEILDHFNAAIVAVELLAKRRQEAAGLRRIVSQQAKTYGAAFTDPGELDRALGTSLHWGSAFENFRRIAKRYLEKQFKFGDGKIVALNIDHFDDPVRQKQPDGYEKIAPISYFSQR
jgi:hypothetical protein